MDGNVPAPGPRQPRRLFTLPRAVLLVLVLALIAALPSLHGLIGRTADTITAKGKYVPQVRSYFIAADETSDALRGSVSMVACRFDAWKRRARTEPSKRRHDSRRIAAVYIPETKPTCALHEETISVTSLQRCARLPETRPRED